MKKIYRYGVGVLLLALLISMQGITADGKPVSYSAMEVNSVTQSKNSIKLSWGKKSVTQYRIYRASAKKNGKYGKYKKVATISGKKKSYTDKVSYEKKYAYRVDGYKKKGKKYIKKYSGVEVAYSGMGNVQWGDYMHYDADVTPEYISLEAYNDCGFVPTAYEIYRSTDGVDYKRIGVVKEKKMSLKYVDNNVERGHSYYYKVRAYKKLTGKEYCEKYTSPLKLTAVNNIGQYKARVLTPESAAVSELTVFLTSDEGNADLYFTAACVNSAVLSYRRSEEDLLDEDEDLVLSKYSYDNETWYEAGREDIVVKPGQSIYLQFASRNGEDFAYQISGMHRAELSLIDVEYDDLYYSFVIRPNENSANAYVNGEWY